MKKGIQYLRELAVLDVIYGDLDDVQTHTDPDEVQCTRPMWQKLVRNAPPSCANSLAILIWKDGEGPTVNEAASNLQEYEESISSSFVSAVEKLSRKVQRLEEDRSYSPPIRTSVSTIRSQRSSAQGRGYRGYTPRGTLWFYLRDHGEDMRKWDGKPTSTLEARVPVHRRQYRTNRDSLIPIHELIRRLESQGVISKTHSPFNSPIWPVQKSNGEWRLTVDYHGLNEVMPPLSAAVPDMLELQYELESKAAKLYASIDIANAFFSIPLAAECRPQFAFTWRGLQYTWNRLPQGWKHSPTTCHGLIQTALEQGEAPEHLQYIDDIIVWGNTAEEVFEKGKKIVQILLKAGFAIKQKREDERAGPSPEEEEEEHLDEMESTRSLSLSELRDMRKDFSRRPGEHVVTWLLRCWDKGSSSLELEGKEAKQLGSLSMEGGIDKANGKGAPALSLWRRLLSAMKERYPFKEDVIYCPGKWTTMEKGIQYLRELAVLDMIYGDPDNKKLPKDPDEVRCTRPMWRKLVRNVPSLCANSLAILTWKDGGGLTVDEADSHLWEYEESISSSLVSTLEKLFRKFQRLEEDKFLLPTCRDQYLSY
ncbi:hypothetical protein QYF61_015720 [Mycteria americana]|uniref:ribonuclease H n=1 Tax=Mycteria americana TaxID=33587 RepID=A0AAN7MT85_MYCAM|nr:hypothetical protein QYF61_015720 [Mycteria americana]